MSDTPPAGYASERVIPDPPPGAADALYRGQLLDQHRHFVEMTMRYWGHIETANQFFLSLHAVILSGFTYLFTAEARLPSPVLAALVAVASAMALQWLLVLRSLRRLNQARHEIIQEWELSLPARPYRVEYRKLYGGGGPRLSRYFRVQRLYMAVPLLVLAAYLAFGLLIHFDIRMR